MEPTTLLHVNGAASILSATAATTSAGALKVGSQAGSDYVNIGGGAIVAGGNVTVGAGIAASALGNLAVNGGSNTNKGPYISLQRGNADVSYVGTRAAILGDAGGNGSDLILFTNGTFAINFATNGTEKMRLSTAGGLSIGNGVVGTDAGAGGLLMSGNLTVNGTGPQTLGGTAARVTIGEASANARLTLPAGGTAALSAPIRFTTQASPLTVVEQGAMELVGNSLQFTQLAKRRGVMMGQGVIITDTTVGNSSAESAALATASHGANYLEIGKCERIVLRGIIAQRSNSNAKLSFFVKYAGATVQTLVTPVSTTIAANTPFELSILCTCRTTGASGTMRIDAFMTIGGVTTNDPGVGALVTVDTTTTQDTTVTCQWGETNASDTMTLSQGYVQCIEPNR